MPENSFEISLTLFQLGVTMFCANLLLLNRNHRALFLPLALFFVAESIVGATDLLIEFTGSDQLTKRELLWIGLAASASVCEPFLFWSYVKVLTSENGVEKLRPRGWHYLPFILAVLTVLSVFSLPNVLFETPDIDIESLNLLQLLPILFLEFLDFFFQIMVLIYLWLIINQLRTYTNRLKDLFATTEDRELLWVWWIAFVVGIYLVLGVVGTLASFFALENSIHPIFESDYANSLASFAIVWIIALWGLRQQPGLIREQPTFEAIAEKEEASGPKYERSALTEDRAKRIASKIERAMSNDLVYRDPNLSLWDLAKHIGVTSAYVSQTLNTTIGSNFFDYINSWRVRDAVEQLQNSDETILVITYDVGFNSRSSFYKAFKREMATTPSELRTKLRAQS